MWANVRGSVVVAMPARRVWCVGRRMAGGRASMRTQVIYRSYWEKFAFMWCEKQDDIKSWSSEETVIPYISAIDNKYHRYFVDLKLNMYLYGTHCQNS
mgnify:CR=1 FL=1